MTLADRLRGVVGGGLRNSLPAEAGSHMWLPPSGGRDSGRPPAAPAHIAELLGGQSREWHGHSYLVIDRTYPPGHRHGAVSVADSAPGQHDGWPALSILAPTADDRRRVLFIDLETTGLAGGAGTYAFLVGCGWFEGPLFRVRQFLLTAFGAERGLLEEVAGTAGGAGALATYNGKTFDLPLIDMRFLFHRMATPFDGLAHVDMLHPARRLWRHAGSDDGRATCRLAAVEEAVLGYVRAGDVPGFEIPSRYFQFVRSGDPRPLEAVLEHNRLDLLSLALLTARAARLLEEGAAAARTSREALGLGRLYERRGMAGEAHACFARAVDLDGDSSTHAEALYGYGVLCRRERRYLDAADAWRRVLELRGCPPRIAQDATEALAIHHEHRVRDLRAARRFAAQTLQFNISTLRVQAVRDRLARLDRKLACDSEAQPFRAT